jgi:hypothetical protein
MGDFARDWKDHGYPMFSDGCIEAAFRDNAHLIAFEEFKREADAAIKTLEQMKFEYRGGELWKPPLGTKKEFGVPPEEKLRELGDAAFDFCIRVLGGNAREGELEILPQMADTLIWICQRELL